MTNDQYLRALENFTVTQMPHLTAAEVSGSLSTLLGRVIVSAAGGEQGLTETFLEMARHTLDIEVGKALKTYALS